MSSQHKGFKCLSKEGKIFISKDVTFNEHHFPFPKLFAKESIPSSSHTRGYVSCPISVSSIPVAVPFMLVPTVSFMTQHVNNGTSPGHIIVPNSTDHPPLTDKGNNQNFVHKVHNPERLSQTIGPTTIPN